MSLRFDELAAPMFEGPDGRQLRMRDTAIPFDTVVAGVHRELFKRLPASFRRQEYAYVRLRSLPVRPIGLEPLLGRWRIFAEETTGISEIEVAEGGPGEVTVRVLGSGPDDAPDLGDSPARGLAEDVIRRGVRLE
jgi:hypothetical protein